MSRKKEYVLLVILSVIVLVAGGGLPGGVVVAMLVMMNFSANVDHALNQEKLSVGYIDMTHSDRGAEEMVETESEEEKERKSHKSKPGTRQILKDIKRISKKSMMDLSARKGK